MINVSQCGLDLISSMLTRGNDGKGFTLDCGPIKTLFEKLDLVLVMAKALVVDEALRLEGLHKFLPDK